jgi:hypothetical protein
MIGRSRYGNREWWQVIVPLVIAAVSVAIAVTPLA